MHILKQSCYICPMAIWDLTFHIGQKKKKRKNKLSANLINFLIKKNTSITHSQNLKIINYYLVVIGIRE